jgi:hypothetical protein
VFELSLGFFNDDTKYDEKMLRNFSRMKMEGKANWFYIIKLFLASFAIPCHRSLDDFQVKRGKFVLVIFSDFHFIFFGHLQAR